MMMRIDDRQLGFEDRLLLLSCQPRIVGLAAVTEPAWLDGLRHRDAPILSKLPGFPARDGHRLAFSAHSKVPAASIEHRSQFNLLQEHGHYIGLELGADISADLNLDDFLGIRQ